LEFKKLKNVSIQINGGLHMDYRERKKEEAKREKREKWHTEKTDKECPNCRTSNELEAKFCQECGFKFPEDNIPIKREPVPQAISKLKEEVLVEKKEEVKEKKKSFFSPAQIESIRKSEEKRREEKMKKKEETTAQAMKVAEAQEPETVSEAIYVADKYRIQKFTPQGEFITKWEKESGGDGEFSSFIFGIAILKK